MEEEFQKKFFSSKSRKQKLEGGGWKCFDSAIE